MLRAAARNGGFPMLDSSKIATVFVMGIALALHILWPRHKTRGRTRGIGNEFVLAATCASPAGSGQEKWT
jgi:hypothetical protein